MRILSDFAGLRKPRLPHFWRTVAVICFLGAIGVFIAILLSSCAATELLAKKAEAVGAQAVADATSPAGRQILDDAASAALSAGLDAATGNEAAAVIAGVEGGASLLRDYEGLKNAPSAATLAQAVAVGSGVATVAQTVAPQIAAIVTSTKKKAATARVSLQADDITEAIARGLDAVAVAAPPVATNGTGGEAP